METVRSIELRELSRLECLTLLASADHGHLAITERALPALVPVRMQLVLDEVIIEPLLSDAISLIPGCVVAMEAGTFGEGTASEWAVEVCGFLNVWRNGPFTHTPDRFENTGTFTISTDRVRGWMTQHDE